MELVQDLFLTASVALILSFLVAKLVAVAIGGRESEAAEFKVSEKNAGEGVVMEEVRFEERLKKEGFESQRKVEFVGVVKEVDQFEAKPVHRVEEFVEPLQDRQEEARELTESLAVILPKKSSDAEEEEVSVEKATDFALDRELGYEAEQNSENRGFKEIGEESAPNDVVAAQSEEVRVVTSDEPKGKSETKEVKLGNYSDEDDWEGIEKSELDEEFAAAVKSEGQ